MRILHWFRSDLRLTDNTSLFHAAKDATRGVIALYVPAPTEWKAHDISPIQVDFRLRSLAVVGADLRKLNIPLLIRPSRKPTDVSGIILELVKEFEINAVYFNAEYEVDESRRDRDFIQACQRQGINAKAFVDQSLLDPSSVRTGAGRPFTVFTPFKNAWLKRLAELHKEKQDPQLHPAPSRQRPLKIRDDEIPTTITGFESHIPFKSRASVWPAGEHAAQKQLASFVQTRGSRYKADRDIPSLRGTSKLSAALAVGTISAKQCFLAAAKANKNQFSGGSLGLSTWISELIWREFYIHVTAGFPRVCMNRAFRVQTDRLKWSYDQKHFEAWKEGRTGYPIVDAAMRQLNTTGWMHNRLRMLAAMFLAKDLFIDWRWGEKYFMNNLIDGFFASNNGGWQWSASTGTDAAPYFRILSPLSQSQRFDPDGDFIRAFVPELASLSSKDIHDPTPDQRRGLGYPAPIVDHAKARLHAIAAFKALKS